MGPPNELYHATPRGNLESILQHGLKPRPRDREGGLKENRGLLFASADKDVAYSIGSIRAQWWNTLEVRKSMSDFALKELIRRTSVVAVITIKNTREAGFRFCFASFADVTPEDKRYKPFPQWVTSQTLEPAKHFSKIELYPVSKLHPFSESQGVDYPEGVYFRCPGEEPIEVVMFL